MGPTGIALILSLICLFYTLNFWNICLVLCEVEGIYNILVWEKSAFGLF
jgi:hypothetical protein